MDTTRVRITGLPATERVGTFQVTTRLMPSYEPPPEADTKPTPAGRVSVTTRFTASVGPALDTERVYVRLFPGTAAPADFVTERSALVTAVVAVTRSSEGSGSAGEPVAATMLVTFPDVRGSTET